MSPPTASQGASHIFQTLYMFLPSKYYSSSSIRNTIDHCLNSPHGFLFWPTTPIPPPVSFNKTVLRDLDQTFNTIDGQLTHTLDSVEDNIEHIDKQPDTRTTTMCYAALTLSIFSCIMSLLLTYLFFTTACNGTKKRNGCETGYSPDEANTCPGCNKKRSPNYVTNTGQDPGK